MITLILVIAAGVVLGLVLFNYPKQIFKALVGLCVLAVVLYQVNQENLLDNGFLWLGLVGLAVYFFVRHGRRVGDWS